MIVAVLEHLANDTDSVCIVDLNKIDESDFEQVQYRDAILASIEVEKVKQPDVDTEAYAVWQKLYNRAELGEGIAYDYHSIEWAHLIVQPPCHIDAVGYIWEGAN